jgi:spermidine synthase
VTAGRAELLADADRPGAYLLVVAGVAQSYVDLIEPTEIEFDYVRWFAALADALGEPPPALLSVLHIGGGGATLARYVAAARPGSAQTVVENDAPLADGVRERLGVDGFEMVVADGRGHVEGSPDGSVDLVVTDAFVGSRVPAHLTTEGYLREVRRVLREGGAYAVNVADQQPLAYARRVIATVAELFGSVLVVAEPAVLRGRRFGNLVAVGSEAPLPVDTLRRTLAGDAAAPARVLADAELRALIREVRPLTDADPSDSPEPPPGTFAVR